MMRDPDQVWTFQAVRMAYRDEPLRVLEERQFPASECTIDAARMLFMRRFEDPEYAKRFGVSKLEAVRFIDETEAEVLRYSLYHYYRDLIAREAEAAQVT